MAAAFASSPFIGAKAGDEREVGGIKLCWCPPGKFTMGSPPSEPERRPGEDQVEVTLTKGFWMAKYEATQGQWKRVVGKLPGLLTAELPEGDDYPVGNVNFAEAEGFCEANGPCASPATCPMAGSFDCRPKRSGSMRAGPARRRPRRSATRSAANRQTSKASHTTVPRKDRHSARRQKLAVIPRTRGAFAICTATLANGAEIGTHAKLPGGTDPDLYFAKATAQKNQTGDYSRSRRGGTWTDDGWPNRSAFRQRFEPERRYDHIGFRVVVIQR